MAVPGYNDFERNTLARYQFGDVWDEREVGPSNKLHYSTWDIPNHSISLRDVEHVYLRKGGSRKEKDNPYHLGYIIVTLYGTGPPVGSREFKRMEPARLSNDSGLQVWLIEDVSVYKSAGEKVIPLTNMAKPIERTTEKVR